MSGVGPSPDFSLAQRVPMTDLEQTQSKTRRPLLQARVDDATEADFAALAAKRGMSPSELLRAIVARELAGGNCQLGDIEVDPENADSRRMTIRIPSFAHQAVCAIKLIAHIVECSAVAVELVMGYGKYLVVWLNAQSQFCNSSSH